MPPDNNAPATNIMPQAPADDDDPPPASPRSPVRRYDPSITDRVMYNYTEEDKQFAIGMNWIHIPL